MSFICQKCGKPSPPKSPCTFEVVEVRPKRYPGVDGELGVLGCEIVKEMKVCQECVGVRPQSTVAGEKAEQQLLLRVEQIHQHARTCKKPFDDCSVCQENLRVSNTLPPRVLAKALSDSGKGSPGLHRVHA